MYDNASQLYAALLFTAGGAAMYCAYEALFIVRLSGRYKILPHFIDFVFAASAALLFLGLTHFLYKGVVKYFTIFCYAVGILISRAILRPPLRKFFAAVRKKYKIRYERDTIDKREEDTKMANKEQQKKDNQKNAKTKKTAKAKA